MKARAKVSGQKSRGEKTRGAKDRPCCVRDTHNFKLQESSRSFKRVKMVAMMSDGSVNSKAICNGTYSRRFEADDNYT